MPPYFRRYHDIPHLGSWFHRHPALAQSVAAGRVSHADGCGESRAGGVRLPKAISTSSPRPRLGVTLRRRAIAMPRPPSFLIFGSARCWTTMTLSGPAAAPPPSGILGRTAADQRSTFRFEGVLATASPPPKPLPSGHPKAELQQTSCQPPWRGAPTRAIGPPSDWGLDIAQATVASHEDGGPR